MRIISNKRYEEISQELTNLNLDIKDLKEQIDIYDEQVTYLVKGNKELESNNEFLKKETKRLKSLLTKNGINYKKENKDGRK